MSAPQNFYYRYEHYIRAAVIISGFAFDLVIAKRPDSVFVNVLLLTYLAVSAACIIILSSRRERALADTQSTVILLVLQFCFGGLASNLLILYGKSGTVAGDFLFVGLLAALLIGNEFMKDRYAEMRFNIAMYYVLLLTYSVIAVPTFILHDIGASAFLWSGAASLAAVAIFLALLHMTARVYRGRDGARRLRDSILTVAAVFIVFNACYFLNIIPPVPLALKDIGIYHSVVRDSADSYIATYEPVPWWEFWRDTSDTFTAGSGASAYCFSSVFAPTGLGTPVHHLWEHYNSVTRNWDTLADIAFPISGGRTEGYRGFSSIQGVLAAGDWRCDVETQAGQLIGRSTFSVVAGTAPLLSVTKL